MSQLNPPLMTPAGLAADRRNSLKSTSLRPARGKAQLPMNSVRDGLEFARPPKPVAVLAGTSARRRCGWKRSRCPDTGASRRPQILRTCGSSVIDENLCGRSIMAIRKMKEQRHKESVCKPERSLELIDNKELA